MEANFCIQVLKDAGVVISTDGHVSWWDHIYVERFGRSLEYEDIYLNVYGTVRESRTRIGSVLPGVITA